MITEEKIYSIYSKSISEEEITTKVLKELDFNSHDITKLCRDGIIKRIKRGYYTLELSDKLKQYMLDLSKKGNSSCITLLTELKDELNDRNFLLQLFIDFVKNNSYSEASYILDITYQVEKDDDYKRDYLVYFILLSHLIRIPVSYEKMIKNIKFSDVKIQKSDRFVNANAMNAIRYKILDGKFKEASVAVKYLLNNNNVRTEYITRLLLKGVLDKEKETEKKEKAAVQKGSLDEIYNILVSKSASDLEIAVDNYLEGHSFEEIKLGRLIAFLGLFEGNDAITETLTDLVRIKNSTINTRLRVYLEFMKDAYLEHDYAKAGMYLNIVKNICTISGENIELANIEEKVGQLKKLAGYSNKSTYKLIKGACERGRELNCNPKVFIRKPAVHISLDKINEYFKAVENDSLYELTPPLDSESVETLLNVARRTSDKKIQIIEYNNQKYGLITHKPFRAGYISYSRLISKSNEALFDGDVKEAFFWLRKCIHCIPQPKWFVYEILRDAYILEGDLKRAAECAKVAQYLSSIDPTSKDDYTASILKLETDLYEQENLIKRKKQERNLLIQELEKYAVSIFNGEVSLEALIAQHILTDEEVRCVKLLLAKHYYASFNSQTGDELWNSVMELSDNSDVIIEIAEIVKFIERRKEIFEKYKENSSGYIIKPIRGKE